MIYVIINGTTITTAIPIPKDIQPPGIIDRIPGTPPTPIELAFTPCNVINAPAIDEPIIAAINGYLNRKFTPNIAGSVIPNQADKPEVPANPFVLSFLVANIIANAARSEERRVGKECSSMC